MLTTAKILRYILRRINRFFCLLTYYVDMYIYNRVKAPKLKFYHAWIYRFGMWLDAGFDPSGDALIHYLIPHNIRWKLRTGE